MSLLKEKDREYLKDAFSKLENDVKIVLFTQENECQYCELTRQMAQEVAELSDRIHLEVYDFVKDKEQAEKYKVDKIPALVLLGDRDYGIRFYGIPAGYEFTTLVEDILDVGRRDPGLEPEILKGLEKVDKPVHMQAIVSPTCPYCPKAVRTAHKFAMASEYITGDMVEVSEFPHLAVKYDVQGVPKTVINETVEIVGAQPTENFLEAVLQAIGKA